jgi:predicted PurR-regulated permease PerM
LTTAAIARAVAVVAAALTIFYAAYLVRDILLILYVSVLLSVGLGPLVRRIEHAVPAGVPRPPRWLAVLGIYLIVVGFFTVLGLMIVPPLIVQVQELWQRVPEFIANGQGWLMYYGILDHELTLEEAVRNAPGPGDAFGTVAMALTSTLTGLAAFITVLILTFYLLLESDDLFDGFTRLFPRADRPRVDAVARQISTKISAWLSGQMILAGTIGVMTALGLYLLGIPYFYVLALLGAIGEMIPVVGPVLSAIPAVGVAMTISPRSAVFVALLMLAIQQFENHILVPKVMERQVGVSAVTVIVALLMGAMLLGIVGALLAVPTAAIVQVIIQELLNERDRRADDALGPRFD